MIRTFRSRFIISHLLPTLVIIPLMGITLIYLLEYQVVVGAFSGEMAEQAVIMGELTKEYSGIWNTGSLAQQFVTRMSPIISGRVTVINSSGKILASNDPSKSSQINTVLAAGKLQQALAGNQDQEVSYTQNLSTDKVDVLVPIHGTNNEVTGVIQLTTSLSSELDHFQQMRILIAIVLAGGLALAGILGWFLAFELERPMRQVTEAVQNLTKGQQANHLPDNRLKEMSALAGAVNTLVDRLNSLEQARRQLLANLVHEINRPLGALNSAIQALKGGAFEQDSLRNEMLAGMDSEIRRLQNLTNDLTRFYDEFIGSLELNCQPVEMRFWLLTQAATWREAAQDKKLHWEVDIPEELPVLKIDQDRLAQALGNLFSNAIKFTPPGGSVSVQAGLENSSHDRTQGKVWIRVADTGVGIPESERELIFKPLYRGQSNRRFPQGMGIGLTIARDLTVAHGGQLTVESAVGEGSQFTIWLPVDK